MQAVMHGYVAWALEFPQRFKLVFGSWSRDSDELAAAAGSARALFTGVVTVAQRTGQLPAGDPERLASLLASAAPTGQLAPKQTNGLNGSPAVAAASASAGLVPAASRRW